MGESNAEPLLGVTALESVGIEVDPRNQDAHEAAGGAAEGATNARTTPAYITLTMEMDYSEQLRT